MSFISILLLVFFGLLIYFLFYLTSKNTSKLVIASLITTLVFIFLLGCLLYESLSQLNKIGDYSKLGPFGDYIGGLVNPLISVFAVVAAGFAFYAQYEANKLVQEQFVKQEKKEYRQNFESKLFVLVEFQNQIVQNIDINKTIFNSELIIEIIDNNPIINSKYEEFHLENILESQFINEEVKSRDSFKFFFELLDNILSISNDYLQNHNHSNIEVEQEVEQEAAEGQEGVEEEQEAAVVVEQGVEEEQEAEVVEEQGAEVEPVEVVENYFDVFRINFEKRIIHSNNKIVEDYFDSIYEMLFGKLKIDLGHYYRNLYRIFKIIDQANFDKNDDIDFKIKYEYASIVRSQLSDFELYFLFYNGLSQYGNLKFKKLIEKYSLLKIIPIKNNNLQFHKYYELYDTKAFNNKLKV